MAIIKYGVFFAWVCLLVLTCGCSKSTKKSLWDQLKQLDQEKTTLKLEVERLESENEDLTEQVENLSVLGPEARLEAMPLLKSITLGQRTGLFDKDKNGTKEKLIVYVRPLDETGDPIKAPGKMQVQLWDLNVEANEALLNQWDVEPDQLKMLWAPTMMTNYYRLTFDVAELISDDQQELTVKVEFTDYITGKILRDQKVIEP